MEKVSSVTGLKNFIQILEVEQRIKGRELKEQVFLTYESLKPINLLRNTFKELFSSQYASENISGSVMGAVSGFLIKFFFIGASANKFRKLIGNVLQFGMTNIIAQNSDKIKAFGQALFQQFFSKKEKNSKKHSSSKDND
jgi:hypothetical protein